VPETTVNLLSYDRLCPSGQRSAPNGHTGLVDLRAGSRWAGGSHLYDGGEQLVTGWHFHDVHEIEYACRGMVEVKTEAGHYAL
jgi:hypothetical protein